MEELIRLTEKKLALLKELKESIAFEAADYIVAHLPRGFDTDYYLLVEKETENIKHAGRKTSIQKYLDKRQITKVYWKHLI